jgi:single-stranded-DNA-specific exonuclease
MAPGTWQLESCAFADVRDLADELSVSEITASVLVRRGLGNAADAQRFLDGALPGHDPFLLGDMRDAVDRLRAAIASGARICVHGDYDADGICATALGVLLLRELGADVAWHLPSRFEEGYGLNAGTLTRFAGEGFDLVLTVDCGITAVAEVEHARELGLEVIVTDHHRPADAFPACPVVAPLKGDYPFSGLCGTAVVWKLAEALLGAGHPFLDRHLDVVALATVADVVPLVDENRALALSGLRRLAQTQKQGLRALMRVAGVDAAAVDESSIGFRLAPRINASGRLCRPEAALALLLTEDEAEAKGLAEELEGLNRERQAIEERILRQAVDQVESWPESRRRARGYVVAGEGWHEGVIGIVASRLVERYNRPVVLIAGADDTWKGSGRSVAAFDLHGGLGPDDRARPGRSVRDGLRRARRRGAERRRPAARDEDRRDRPRLDPDSRALRRAGAARSVRAGEPGRDAARRRLRGRRSVHGRRRQAPALPRPPPRPRRGLRDRVRPRRPARPLPPRGALRRRVQAAGEPLERRRLAAARRAACVRRARRLRGATRLAGGSVEGG